MTRERIPVHFSVPENTDLLIEMGTVGVWHSHLDYVLKMFIKSLTGVTIDEVRTATNFHGSAKLRTRIYKIARKRIRDDAAMIRVESLLERCRVVTERRNALVHGIYAQDRDGEPIMSGSDWSWKDLPTPDELKALSTDIKRLIDEINDFRLHGKLSAAMAAKK
jgi:hypothetical protein